jgi:uncharacterized protein (DUF1697 family)
MSERKFLALLRGINVGGNNIIKMTDLKSCFEEMGFTSVLTYIQSGNVIFTTEGSVSRLLTKRIESVLSERFSYDSKIVLVPEEKLESVVSDAPPGFGVQPDKYRYDVVFLMDGVSPSDILGLLNPRDGVDDAWSGEQILYFRRLSSKASQSRLTRLAGLSVYKSVSIRNWNTTVKLLSLMKERTADMAPVKNNQ